MKTKATLLCLLTLLGFAARAGAQGDTLVISDAATGFRPVHLYMPHTRPTELGLSSLEANLCDNTRLSGTALGVFSPDKDSDVTFSLFGHADGFLKQLDLDDNGWMDDPKHLNFILGTSWEIGLPREASLIFGVRGMLDNRLGGQNGNDDVLPVIFARDKVRGYAKNGSWQACIVSRSGDAFAELHIPFEEMVLDVSADYSYQWMNSTFGNENLLPQLVNIYYGHHATAGPDPTCRIYDTSWGSALLKAEMNGRDGTGPRFGIIDRLDDFDEAYCDTYNSIRTPLNDLGAFYDYRYVNGAFDITAGARVDWFNRAGFRWAPVFKAAWTPSEALRVFVDATRKHRYVFSLLENLGPLATGKVLDGHVVEHPLEDAWSYGAGAKWNIGGSENHHLTLGVHRTSYVEQLYTDYDIKAGHIGFVLLSETENRKSYVNEATIGLHTEPLRGLEVDLGGIYTDAKQSFDGRGVLERPLVHTWKGKLDIRFAPGKGKWVFETKTLLNGPCRVWDFMDTGDLYKDGRTPAYALVSARITKKFKGYEFYVGGDNLTGFTQPVFLIGIDDPFSRGFDASSLWAPITGLEIYLGFKMNLRFI